FEISAVTGPDTSREGRIVRPEKAANAARTSWMSAFSHAMVMRGCCERCCIDTKRDVPNVGSRRGSLTLDVVDRASLVTTRAARSATVFVGTSKPTCQVVTRLLLPSMDTRTSCFPRTTEYGLALSSVRPTRTMVFRNCELRTAT